LRILIILYNNGIIRGFHILSDFTILVFLKYYQNRPTFFAITLVSKPGKRIFFKLSKLSKNFNKNAFAGFFVISTSKGLITSNDALLGYGNSGEILLKVYI